MHSITRTDAALTSIPTKRDWIVPLSLALLSACLGAYNAYNNNDKAITGRVLVVETQQKNDSQRLEHIDQQLDKLDDKMDRLLERR